ncbi:hypothetical protein [Halorarum salinum]|uniref:Uncharacterized protein n=1 Tax=Halorarum salinum TaxID=2743089 RepID=A0A7D5QGW6_9EURY|nr:hypothetical protein [Halobaculum salinum]QLG62302.1 hypothetical protein HUG12_11420 [Halobaculum salinum]
MTADADVPAGGRRDDAPRSRRGVLASLAGVAGLAVTAGCSSGGGEPVAGDGATSSPSTRTEHDGTTAARERTVTATATPTATREPTATPVAAAVPPNGSLRLVDSGVSVSAGGGSTEGDAFVRLRNVGGPTPVTYEVLELRFDLLYTAVDGDRTRVATAYGTAGFRDERDGGFAPGETGTVRAAIEFDRDGRAERSTDDERFDVEFAYRRVAYR